MEQSLRSSLNSMHQDSSFRPLQRSHDDEDMILLDEATVASSPGTATAATTATATSRRTDVCSSTLQPTPINPSRAVSVDRVSLTTAPWYKDVAYLESLKLLLEDKASTTADESVDVPRPVPSSQPTSTTITPLMPHLVIRSADSVSTLTNRSADKQSSSSFRVSQVDLWNARFNDLLGFHRQHGHCLVPLKYVKNISLSHWIKRQRYQYRMKKTGKHSTMTDERQAALEMVGFVWDSHAAGWEEKWEELRDFKETHGHCNVPKTFRPNQQLAVWVKSQRRQFKVFWQEGKTTTANITKERIEKLLHLGFDFNPRQSGGKR
jgi:hypothetical protein